MPCAPTRSGETLDKFADWKEKRITCINSEARRPGHWTALPWDLWLFEYSTLHMMSRPLGTVPLASFLLSLLIGYKWRSRQVGASCASSCCSSCSTICSHLRSTSQFKKLTNWVQILSDSLWISVCTRQIEFVLSQLLLVLVKALHLAMCQNGNQDSSVSNDLCTCNRPDPWQSFGPSSTSMSLMCSICFLLCTWKFKHLIG